MASSLSTSWRAMSGRFLLAHRRAPPSTCGASDLRCTGQANLDAARLATSTQQKAKHLYRAHRAYLALADSGANPALISAKNGELYIGGSWGPLTAKYNYAVTDFFGAPDSNGSWYLNVAAAHDFGNGFGINGAIGYQALKGGAKVTQINGSVVDSITDWKLGGTYTVDGWVMGLAYISTNRKQAQPIHRHLRDLFTPTGAWLPTPTRT